MLSEDARRSLEALFPKGQVTTNPVELITYEIDGGLNPGRPDGVVFPLRKEDVVRLARWAGEYCVPLVGRGSGTGLSGGAVPSNGGIVVSFARMNRVLEVNETDPLAVVEPGVINLALDALAKSQHYCYPPDPASQRACAIGGNVAENAGGPHCFKYGVTTNYVAGLEAVLADGQVIRTGGRGFDYPEYDFTGLLTGSEGTLALLTGVCLRLIRNPAAFKTLLATFDSVQEVGEAVSAIIAEGLVPAALEMMDRNIAGIIEAYVHAGLPTEAAALLLVEVDGYPESLDSQMNEIVALLKRRNARQLHICQTAAERDQIWLARKSAFGAMARISPAYFQVDGTVPRSKLAETLGGINKICERLGLKVGYVFHAGDGNLHPMIPFDPADEDMESRVRQAGDEILNLCVSKDGSISGEHGVGLDKRRFMPSMYNIDELGAMREVKEVFDPQEILNPGKIFPPDMILPLRQEGTASARLPSLFTPQSEHEAAEGLRTAQAIGQLVTITGGGMLQPPTLPLGATVLSSKALTGIAALVPDDLYVTVKAGTRLAEVQEALTGHHLWVPLYSPWIETTVGGILSTAFNSPCRMKYGSVRDQVLGLRVVLPDGRCVRFGRPVVKNVAGYDMVKLFVGAYGTLGLITEATLRLTALPRVRHTLLLRVDDMEIGLSVGESFHHTCSMTSALLFLSGCHVPDLAPSPYLLLLSAEGYPEDVDADLSVARAMANWTEIGGLCWNDLWSRLFHNSPSYLRIGVPPSKLPAFLKANAMALGEVYAADLASGLVHICPAPLAEISRLRSAALATGGYAVVVGAPRESSVEAWGYVPETLPLMRRLKARWDPKGYLNAGTFLV